MGSDDSTSGEEKDAKSVPPGMAPTKFDRVGRWLRRAMEACIVTMLGEDDEPAGENGDCSPQRNSIQGIAERMMEADTAEHSPGPR